MTAAACLLGLLAPASVTAAPNGTLQAPAHLTTGAMSNPMGIADRTPTLGWRNVAHGHNQTQTAYQVRAASSPTLLDENRPDLWDSGKVLSRDSVAVPYAGRKLGSRQRVHWQVRVWDAHGKVTPWSRHAFFETGLAESDWTAEWISNRQWTRPHAYSVELPAQDSRYLQLTVVDLGRPGEALDSPDWKPRLEIAEITVTDSERPGVNLAEGAAVTVSERADEPGAWAPEYMVDGKLTSADAPHGYRSENHPETDVQDRPIVLRLDLGEVRHFDTVRVYPRWDTPSQWGMTPNFPREIRFGVPSAPEGPVTEIARVKDLEPISSLHEQPDALPIFAKPFAVDRPLRSARLYVTGVGVYHATVNGRKVTDAVLEPPNTDHHDSLVYSTYDVTPLLRRGANVIGAELGNGLFNVFNTPDDPDRYIKAQSGHGPPRLLAQLELTYADGTTDVVATDESWRTTLGATTFSNWYGGEDVDARRHQPGWNAPGADLGDWDHAVTVEAPAPTTRLVGRTAPPITVVDELEPVAITEPRPGVYVADFGVNFAGWQELSVRGPAGTTVTMRPAELLDENGMIDQSTTGQPIRDSYTLRGTGVERWHPTFVYHGFRYLELRGLPAPATKDTVRGLVLRTANDHVGSFSSSDELLNDIHRIIDRAIQSNMYSVLTDCPHREKLGWLEQTSLVFGSVSRNYDVAAYYRKLVADMAQAQTESGMVPTTAPEAALFAGGFREDVNWGATLVLAPWEMYRTYGDSETLRRYYGNMRRYLDYLNGKADGGILGGGLGDWITLDPSTPKEVTATYGYHRVATTMAEIATVLGEHADARRFRGLAERIAAAFNAEFFRPGEHTYASGSQASDAIALHMGVVPAEHRQAVLDHLVDSIRAEGDHLTVGEIGLHAVLKVLSAAGRDDVIYDIATRTDFPSYGYQIVNGATSLGEAWPGPTGKASQNHFMLGAIDEWFTAGLAGIEQAPGSIAYRELVIAPTVVGTLDHVRGSYRTAHGLVRSEWRIDDGTFRLEVEIPANTTATVRVPLDGDAEAVTATGGADPVTVADGVAVFEVGSGTWQFTSPIG